MKHGVVKWDGKFSQWATYFFDVLGPQGDWLCVGHTSERPRWASAFHMRDDHPNPDTAKPRPKPMEYREAFRLNAS